MSMISPMQSKNPWRQPSCSFSVRHGNYSDCAVHRKF